MTYFRPVIIKISLALSTFYYIQNQIDNFWALDVTKDSLHKYSISRLIYNLLSNALFSSYLSVSFTDSSSMTFNKTKSEGFVMIWTVLVDEM